MKPIYSSFLIYVIHMILEYLDKVLHPLKTQYVNILFHKKKTTTKFAHFHLTNPTKFQPK